MCGIFGYIGTKQNAAEMIFEGLKSLEYRGYDSWGIAVKGESFNGEGKRILIQKHIGKIANTPLDLPPSSLGIGHTRWATHGGVTIENAHPHMDCTKQLAVLHNGIVENFQELKDELLKKNHSFKSETDTEVIIHLIEDFLKTTDFVNAVKQTFNLLKGLNAIVVVHTGESQIIAAKNGSPLIIGIADDGFYISSDASGILPYTKKVMFLKDNELVSLSKELVLYSLPEGVKQEPHIETINWNIEQAEKGTYAHFMLKEIHEQPTIIRNIAENYSDQIDDLKEVVEAAKGTFFIGAGTAYHACLAGMYLFSTVAKKHVNTAPASEFNYLEDFLTPESLIIALSQSGETIDVIEPLTRAKKKGSTIVGLVNALGSTIYRMANYKILLGAGPEKAVASTKAYLSKLAILFMLTYAMNNSVAHARDMLLKAADEIERMLQKEYQEQLKHISSVLESAKNIYTIGRGVSYSVALEAALKIKEVSYIHTEGLAGGELKHGPIALIEKGVPCIVFAPKDETYDAIISNATEIKARGGIIIGVSSEKSAIFDHFIEVKDTGLTSIMTHVVPIQVIAYYLALSKGFDPDKPRNLAKSVTVK